LVAGITIFKMPDKILTFKTVKSNFIYLFKNKLSKFGLAVGI